jgi:hypothetical protein
MKVQNYAKGKNYIYEWGWEKRIELAAAKL